MQVKERRYTVDIYFLLYNRIIKELLNFYKRLYSQSIICQEGLKIIYRYKKNATRMRLER